MAPKKKKAEMAAVAIIMPPLPWQATLRHQHGTMIVAPARMNTQIIVRITGGIMKITGIVMSLRFCACWLSFIKILISE